MIGPHVSSQHVGEVVARRVGIVHAEKLEVFHKLRAARSKAEADRSPDHINTVGIEHVTWQPAGRFHDAVGGIVDVVSVVACAADHSILASAAIERVGPAAPYQRVYPGAAPQSVRAVVS